MAKRNTSIRINGKHYDALSGVSLEFEAAPAPAKVRSIDGVVGKGKAPHPIQSAVVTKKVVQPKPSSKTRRSTNHASVKRATSSKTLMRHAVSKPQPSLKRRAKVIVATHHASQVVKANTSLQVRPKASYASVNAHRAQRAASTPTHHQVSRFSKEAALVVADIKQVAAAVDAAIVIPQTYSAPYRPDIRRVKVVTHGQPVTSDIFEQALLRATSHEEEAPELPRGRLRSLRRRMMSFTAGAVAVLALVGFVGFQKQDEVQFRVAATKTSFSATMPGYQAKGFKVANVNATNDYMSVKYANNDREYNVIQRGSTLTSEQLLETLTVANNTQTYAALKANNTTVYVYGKNQAAWVRDGVLYQVLGNGSLSTQDFTKIASSL